MHTYLESLTTTALLGTDKRELPEADAQMHGLGEDDAPEKTLLIQLAAADLYVRGAQQPAADARLHVDPAPTEEKPPLSSEAAYYLRQLYDGKEAQFLPEFLGAVAESGKRIPHAELPELLQMGKRDSSLRTAINRVLTARGYWLARQNAEWGYAVDSNAPQANFETGELMERVAALRELRQHDAAAARDLLAQGWRQEVAKARTDLLKALRVNLSAADEAFLDAALDDKSKNVRRAAADLLTRLPDSGYTQRMTERAAPLIQFEHGGLLVLKRSKLRLTLPEGLDESATRDGLSEDDPPRGMGIKAWCFKQIVGRVPLHVWTSNADLHTLLKACPKGERALLLGSWVDASVRFPNAEHAAELIDYAPTGDTIEALAQHLNDDQAALLAAKTLNQEPLLTASHPLLYLLNQTQFEWPERLQKQFRHSLANLMKKWKRNQDGRIVLDSLVRILPLDLLTLCAQTAPPDAEHPAFNAFVDFQRLAEFRRKMIAAVHESGYTDTKPAQHN